MRCLFTIFASGLLFSLSLDGVAAETSLSPGGAPGRGSQWYLVVENDVPFATDRWYSSGVRLARVQPAGAHEWEWGLVHEVYAPDAKHFRFGDIDRVPAARLLLSVARHDRSADLFQTLQLDAGVRGPGAAGRQVTDAVHEIIPAPDVDWSRQGRNRFDGQLVLAHSRGYAPVQLHYGAVIGTQLAFAHAGLEWRSRASASMSPVLRFAATPTVASPERGWDFFAGASIRGIARNELLEGAYAPFSPPTGFRRGVGRIAAGLGYEGAGYGARLALVQDTREFAAQSAPHRFGSLSVHADF